MLFEHPASRIEHHDSMPFSGVPKTTIGNIDLERTTTMYTVAVQRELIAQHFLIGGDFGPENHLHSHHYRVEVRLTGPSLDSNGFLVDIDEVAALLAEVLETYRDKTLNDLPELQGLNPSLEHLCRVLCRRLAGGLHHRHLSTVTVAIRESDAAGAAFTEELTCP
jgi:6-pyruvoyltetrahydropterin/6-carboxytetrahydropterin synthase